jgi:RNA polymerase sigma-70 factor (ECF subfamily)
MSTDEELRAEARLRLAAQLKILTAQHPRRLEWYGGDALGNETHDLADFRFLYDPTGFLVRVGSEGDVNEALDKLPKHYAAALLLRHYQGLSLAETAQALDITENAAKLRLFRARKAFAQVYGGPEGSTEELR